MLLKGVGVTVLHAGSRLKWFVSSLGYGAYAWVLHSRHNDLRNASECILGASQHTQGSSKLVYTIVVDRSHAVAVV